MKKRILSILLTLVMVLSLLPISAFADENEPQEPQPLAVAATMDDVTITGTVGEELETQTATITLHGDTFASDIDGDVDWVTNLVPGLTVTASGAAGENTAVLTFTGTPDKDYFTDYEYPYFVEAISVTIPGDVLELGADVEVTRNEAAYYLIEVGEVDEPTPTTYVAATSIDVTAATGDTSGTNWRWVQSSKTLYLEGVNIDATEGGGTGPAIKVPDGTVIDSIGLNTLKSASGESTIYGLGNLAIKGSGVLDISDSGSGGSSIYTDGNLVITGGYIKAACGSDGFFNILASGDLVVSGGYVDTTENASPWGIACWGNITISGGYVKAVGASSTGHSTGITVSGTLNVSGGYLEATGSTATGASNSDSTGIGSITFINNGGVVKATSGTSSSGNSYGIQASTSATFNGGVTIAKSGTANNGTSSAFSINGVTTVPVVATPMSTKDHTGAANATATDVVVAKSFNTQPVLDANKNATLDGAYFYSTGTTVPTLDITPVTGTLTVTGGNYVENAGSRSNEAVSNDITNTTMSFAGSGTLVGITAFANQYGNAISINAGDSFIFNGNLIGIAGGNRGGGIYINDMEFNIAGTSTSSANIIGIATNSGSDNGLGPVGISLNPSGNPSISANVNMIGVASNSSLGTGFAATRYEVGDKAFTVAGANITGIGGKYGFLTTKLVANSGSITAVNNGDTSSSKFSTALQDWQDTMTINGARVWAYNQNTTAPNAVIAKTLAITDPSPTNLMKIEGIAKTAAYGDALATAYKSTVSGSSGYDFVSSTENDTTATDPCPIAYIHPEIPVYSVSYMANGGTGTMASKAVTAGQSLTIAANTFTAPEGKVFDKWSTGTDGTGTNYTGGTSITPTEDLALFAQWKDNSSPTPSGGGGGNGQNIPQRITSATAGSKVNIPMNSGSKVHPDELEAAKGKDVNVVYNFGKYIWTINGQSVKGVIAKDGYNLTVTELKNENLSSLAGNSEALQFEITYSGSLPFTGKLTYPIDSQYEGKTLYLYYYNELTKRLEYKASGVVTNGKFSFDFTHASKYVLTTELLDNTEPVVTNVFTDVSERDWFYDAVMAVTEEGLFSGIEADRFGPQAPMTRAMFATVLARLEGADLTGDMISSFTDVNIDSWYGKPVTWAAQNGILTGYGNGTFGPNNSITREEMATMMYRYLKFKGEGFTGTWTFKLPYGDTDKIASWASEGVSYMTMKEIMKGNYNNFNPKATASRAEVAQIFYNYLNSSAE